MKKNNKKMGEAGDNENIKIKYRKRNLSPSFNSSELQPLKGYQNNDGWRNSIENPCLPCITATGLTSRLFS